MAHLVLQELCVKGGCSITTDAATVVKGAPTRYCHYDKPPYNMIKKQKVKCPCGQVYWRHTAIYTTDKKIGLHWES